MPNADSFCLTLILTLSFLWTPEVTAQVQIAPVALYPDDANKTGRIVVRNSSDQPVELSTVLHFAYPAADSEGEVYLKRFETVPEGEPSATEWTRVYPRHLILPPNEQQTIRFAVRPPQNLPNGEYWARPAIVARPVEGLTKQATEEITTQLNLVRRTFLSLNYRHGQVRTGISIQKVSTRLENNTLHLSTSLQREGNAAYLGHIDIQITDASGRTHKHLRKEIAVYHEMAPVYSFDVSDLPPGSYSTEVVLDTEERAEENSDILDAPPASEVTEFIIE